MQDARCKMQCAFSLSLSQYRAHSMLFISWQPSTTSPLPRLMHQDLSKSFQLCSFQPCAPLLQAFEATYWRHDAL